MLFIFYTPELIRNLWQLKTAVFLHYCLICSVPFFVVYMMLYCVEWLLYGYLYFLMGCGTCSFGLRHGLCQHLWGCFGVTVAQFDVELWCGVLFYLLNQFKIDIIRVTGEGRILKILIFYNWFNFNSILFNLFLIPNACTTTISQYM